MVVDVGGGGVIIFDEFFIGGYGMGIDYLEVSFEIEIDGELIEIDVDIDFGYGGFWFGYVRDIE